VDAIVVQCAGPASASCVDVAASRPHIPIVVIGDVDDATATRLIAEGADDVLAASATFDEISRAERRASTRRARQSEPPRRATPAPPLRRNGDVPAPPQLEALGRLAGGVAHDFNNLLLVIDGNAERLLQGLPAREPLRRDVQAIASASRRAAELTRQLLAFGRRQTLIPAVIDLNAMIAELMPVIGEQMGRAVRIVTDLSHDIPPVRADRAQLAAAITNLAASAVESMAGGGTFTIATDALVADNQMKTQRPWLTSGTFVRLQVIDSGMGIDEQALPHLFEPFFTSNGPTRAAGLTLSSVYGIVKQSGGFIWADSHVGEGTRITILLPPAHQGEEHHDARPPASPEQERVLLVEDDDAVREVLVESLRHQGFNVEVAPCGEDALDQWSAGAFDLLVTDVVLPGIDGRQLARQVRTMSPDAPVLFMSGYTGDVLGAADLDSSRSFLQKPFTSAAFIDRVRELIRSGSRRG
jgi:signal transduction histidine kinase